MSKIIFKVMTLVMLTGLTIDLLGWLCGYPAGPNNWLNELSADFGMVALCATWAGWLRP